MAVVGDKVSLDCLSLLLSHTLSDPSDSLPRAHAYCTDTEFLKPLFTRQTKVRVVKNEWNDTGHTVQAAS